MENNPDLSREYYKTRIQQRKKNEKYIRDLRERVQPKEKNEEKDEKKELESEKRLNLLREKVD